MAVLAIFMLAGFICQRIKLLPDSTATVLSRLETYLIMPAYILNTFISNCTPEILSERLPLLMWGAIVAVLSVAIAYPVGRAFSKGKKYKRGNERTVYKNIPFSDVCTGRSFGLHRI